MPSSSACRGPGGTSPAIWSRIALVLREARAVRRELRRGERAGSAPKNSFSSAGSRSSASALVVSVRHSSSARVPFAVIA